MTDFVPFPKISRLNREIVITEKIDGTNACIFIGDFCGDAKPEFLVGSRTRWITPADDNFGFARWAMAHEEELRELGPGTHFGEWWGSGIQRGYGLPKGEKRFSLFNVSKWGDEAARPACCHVVPTLLRAPYGIDVAVSVCLEKLRTEGSVAAPGFMKQEGVVIFHTAGSHLFKVTLERDSEWKGAQS
jgi:hypothetical protein